jgi:hypothetical protein
MSKKFFLIITIITCLVTGVLCAVTSGISTAGSSDAPEKSSFTTNLP